MHDLIDIFLDDDCTSGMISSDDVEGGLVDY